MIRWRFCCVQSISNLWWERIFKEETPGSSVQENLTLWQSASPVADNVTYKNRQKQMNLWTNMVGSVPKVVSIFPFPIWILGISHWNAKFFSLNALLNESAIFRLSKTGEESKPTEIFSGDVIRLDRHYPNQIFFSGDVIRFHHYSSQIFSSVIIRLDRPYPNPYIFIRWRHQARSPFSKPNIFLRWRHQVDRHYPHQICCSGGVIRSDRHYPNKIFFSGDVIRFDRH